MAIDQVLINYYDIYYIKIHILCKAGAIVSADSAEGTEFQINLDCTLSSQIAPKEFS